MVRIENLDRPLTAEERRERALPEGTTVGHVFKIQWAEEVGSAIARRDALREMRRFRAAADSRRCGRGIKMVT